MTSLTFSYHGARPGWEMFVFDEEGTQLLFKEMVPGDTFTVQHPSEEKLGTEIKFLKGGFPDGFFLHTSCSKDIYIGMVIEELDLTVIDGSSLENGQLCDYPDPSGTLLSFSL